MDFILVYAPGGPSSSFFEENRMPAVLAKLLFNAHFKSGLPDPSTQINGRRRRQLKAKIDRLRKYGALV